MARAQKNAAKSVKATSSKAAKATKTASLTNPFREGGGYHATVAGISSLQTETLHPFESIIPAIKKAFGLNWSEFAKKEERNENGKDTEGRLIQNLGVLARPDYGFPLRSQGWEIRFDGRQKVAGLFPCPVQASKPERKAKATKATPTPKATKATSKPQKAEKKTPKGKAQQKPKAVKSNVPAKLAAKVAKSKESNRNAC